jgi:hypothetical protein
MWFVSMFKILKFLILKSATNLISIENSLSFETRQATNFRGLRSDTWPKSVIEIRSVNKPLAKYSGMNLVPFTGLKMGKLHQTGQKLG